MLVCPNAGKVMPLEGRLLDGKFRFTKLLGAGGMGAVWRAQNVRVKKAVAIKLMHAEFAGNPGIMDRFRTEATAAGEIGNPHICDIYDFGMSVLGPYIVLEMLHGRSLGELVQMQGRVDPGLAVLILRQALIGLEAAHAVGIVHRDLKPENIFLHEPTPGHLLVKLMDFGISKFTQGGGEGRTSAGVLMGTPEYMSPEQTEGAAGVDHRTDIWAMGAILYKALTGAEPFSGSTMAAVLVAVSTKTPPPIAQLAPHVPPGLIEVVDRCLAKDPNQRYQSSAELSAALAPFENLGVALPAMPATQTVAPMTAAPMSTPPGPNPVATVITGGPPTSQPPQATVITGGPPPQSGGTFVPQPGKPTWSGEIGRPAGADDSWSLGGAPPDPTPPSTLSGANASTGGGGGSKGLIIGLVALLLIGGGGAAFFLMSGKDKGGKTDGPAGATAGASAGETKTETPPDAKTPPDTKTGDTKVETPPDTKTGDTKTGDTKTGDTKVETPPDTKTDETKTGDTKVDDGKKKDKPKELVNELDFPGTRLAGKMDWEKAKEYCGNLTVGNLKSWRLPKSSELQKFKSNTKLANRKYWTNESSAGRVKVYDFAKGTTEESAPNLGVAYPLCVTHK